MNKVGALSPASARDTEYLLDVGLGKQVISWRHIVAKWWLVAALTDIVHVEAWSDWISKDGVHQNVAYLDGNWPHTRFNENLATLEGTGEDLVRGKANELVLISKGVVGWVLVVWVNEAVTDSEALEVDLQIIFVLELEVV